MCKVQHSSLCWNSGRMLQRSIVALILLSLLCRTSSFHLQKCIHTVLFKGNSGNTRIGVRPLDKLKCVATTISPVSSYQCDNSIAISNSKQTNEKAHKVKPSELLATYGIAYLTTSISFAIISYALCFMLVSHGVDVSSVLKRIGIQPTPAASNAGTAAIAYAMHKAASPIRFPPTVLLTPITAKWIFGKSSTS